MKARSWLRDMKRSTMKRNKTTFTDRVREAVASGEKVKSISFRLEKPPVDMDTRKPKEITLGEILKEGAKIVERAVNPLAKQAERL